jgi:hypothetical protein
MLQEKHRRSPFTFRHFLAPQKLASGLALVLSLAQLFSANSARADFLPFFEKEHSINDITPPPPTLNNFDVAVNQLCGTPGTEVSPTDFQAMMNNNPTVLATIKAYVGGYLVSGRTSDAEFLQDLTDIWFNVKGFDHVFCGEPVRGKVLGGMHFVGRYLDLQNQGLAGRLDNNTQNEQRLPGVVYTVGAIVRVDGGTSYSRVKGYAYTLNAEEILEKGALLYKNNPNSSSRNTTCNANVTDDDLPGQTLTSIFVTREGGIRTFYVLADPSTNVNPSCY